MLISSIRGTLEALGPDWADVSVGGVTFRVSVPASAADELGSPGESVRLFTTLKMRDDGLTLYGFLSEEARLAFELLINVNGVGPRLALSVLSRFTPESLAAAVGSGDPDAFAGVPGVGKKTAARLILELKGKLEGDWALVPRAGEHGDLVEALTSLGYSVAEANTVASSLPRGDSMSLEDKVRLALQRLGGS